MVVNPDDHEAVHPSRRRMELLLTAHIRTLIPRPNMRP